MKILRPSTAMVSSLLLTAVCVFAIPVQTANAFFHSKKLEECNNERVYRTLTERVLPEAMVRDTGVVVTKDGVALGGDNFTLFSGILDGEIKAEYLPKYTDAKYKAVRQNAYDDENKRRECSAFVEVKFDMTAKQGEVYSKILGAEFYLDYTILGTSDGYYVRLEYMERRR